MNKNCRALSTILAILLAVCDIYGAFKPIETAPNESCFFAWLLRHILALSMEMEQLHQPF